MLIKAQCEPMYMCQSSRCVWICLLYFDKFFFTHRSQTPISTKCLCAHIYLWNLNRIQKSWMIRMIRFDADDEFHRIFLMNCIFVSCTHNTQRFSSPILWHSAHLLMWWIFFFVNEHNEMRYIQNIGHFEKLPNFKHHFYLTFDLKFIIVSSSPKLEVIL